MEFLKNQYDVQDTLIKSIRLFKLTAKKAVRECSKFMRRLCMPCLFISELALKKLPIFDSFHQLYLLWDLVLIAVIIANVLMIPFEMAY